MSEKMIEVERTGFLRLKLNGGRTEDLTEEQARDLYLKLKTALGIYDFQPVFPENPQPYIPPWGGTPWTTTTRIVG